MGGGARGPRPHPPVRACLRGEKPLGGGGAFKTKKCGVEPQGRGWRGKRRRCSEGRQAARFPSSQPEGTPPTPSRGSGGSGQEGGGCVRRLFSSSLLQIRVGKESARCAAPRCCSARRPAPCMGSVPVAGLGAERRKCPKTHGALKTCPAAERRASRAGRGRPTLALPQPSGQGSRHGAGQLEPALVCLPRGRAAQTPLQAGGAPPRRGGHTRALGLANTPL